MTEKQKMTSLRWQAQVIILCLLAWASYLFYISPWLMAKATGTTVVSYSIAVLQPIAVAQLYVFVDISISLVLAWAVQKALKPDSFGTWSRFGVLFLLFFSGLVFVQAMLAGGMPQ